MKVLFLNIFQVAIQPPDRFQQLIDFVKKEKPDILGLSEVNNWNEQQFARLKEFQKKTGFTNAAFCESKNGYHLALFSKLRMEEIQVNNEQFRNGMVQCVFKIKRENVRVILVHLTPKTEEERLKEVKVLTKCYNPREKVILMGDLNALSPQDTYDDRFILAEMKKREIIKFGKDRLQKEAITAILQQGFVDCVHQFATRFDSSTPTSMAPPKERYTHFTPLRLDYVFIRNMLPFLKYASVMRTKETGQLSDHYPVAAEFRI